MTSPDNRKWMRHPIQLPVSLKFKNSDKSLNAWHIGEILNISVNGISVFLPSCENFPETGQIKLLCFNINDPVISAIFEPEPIDMTGIIAWVDKKNRQIGIRLTD